jgi:endonuclease III
VTKTTQDRLVQTLLDRYGTTYARQAGIRLADKPAPLYQLLVLATLLSARISGDIAVSAARELFAAGYRTPRAMTAAGWQDRVDALGRGHYRRYDERTATMLGASADLVLSRWRGDLRRLRDAAAGDADRMAGLLTEFPGIGPAGADIYLREVQAVWPGVAPHLDQRVLDGAAKIGLPRSPGPLREAATRAIGPSQPERKLARLAAALVRVSASDRAAREVTAATKG